jgi:phage/plasmid primase-like uncharacterized protein
MNVPAEARDRAHQADILAIAKRYVTLKKATNIEFIGPCPTCGGTNRFGVNVKKQVWHCRCCGKGGDVISLVMHADNVSFAGAVAALTGEAQAAPRASPRRPRNSDPDEDADRNSRAALRIWEAARSIRGTPAEHYLVRVREIDIDQILELDDVLRFQPNCPFGADTSPCLIALVRDIVTDAPKAIQRSALDGDGRKIDRRSLGPTKGGAIKLWEDAEVTYGLVIGEGLETVAVAATRINHRGTLLQPAWALMDSANLSGFPILAGIEALTILVDHDANGVGQAAAASCAKRWSAASRNVIRLMPDALGTDFNDLALNGGGAG